MTECFSKLSFLVIISRSPSEFFQRESYNIFVEIALTKNSTKVGGSNFLGRAARRSRFIRLIPRGLRWYFQIKSSSKSKEQASNPASSYK